MLICHKNPDAITSYCLGVLSNSDWFLHSYNQCIVVSGAAISGLDCILPLQNPACTER